MRARDLASPYLTVSADVDALDAARLLVREQLPALLVLDRDDYPYTAVPSARVIGAVLPWYMREEPSLAADVDDDFDEEVRGSMTGRSVAMAVPPARTKLRAGGGCPVAASHPRSSARTLRLHRSPR